MTTTVQGWQTGIARQNGVVDQTVTIGNIILIKKMLTHTAEAEGEMLDFKDMFGEYFKTKLPQYKYFLSVGSSSTQAWKINDDGTYEVIDPTKLNNDGKDNFETMGVMKSINPAGATDLTNYLISQNLNDNNKVTILVMTDETNNFLFEETELQKPIQKKRGKAGGKRKSSKKRGKASGKKKLSKKQKLFRKKK